MSFFEGFADGFEEDFGKDKGIDTTTTKTQDISKVANQNIKAAALMLDKLGKDWKKDVYRIEGMKTLVKVYIEHDIAYFFSEEIYVVDIQSSLHRYMVCWMGTPRGGD